MKRRKYGKQIWNRIFEVAFAGILLVFSVTGLLFWMRPKTSEIEKRELAKVPKFKISAVWDGSYFTELERWYTDTYPLRESFVARGGDWESIYGVHGTELYGDVTVHSDDIPDEENVSEAAIIETPSHPETATSQDAYAAADSILNSTGETTESTEISYEEPETGAGITLSEEPETAGRVYIEGGMAFNIFGFSQNTADYYASMVNTLRARMPSNVRFYEMLVPTAFGVYLSDDIQESLGSVEGEAIDYIYKQLNDKVKAVNTLDILKRHNSEYIYYRSDHHWTQRGAYYAYFEWCKAKEVEPHKLEDFETVTYDGFLGTFYAASNQSATLGNNPDSLETFIPMGTNLMSCTDQNGMTFQWPVINDVTEYPTGVKYSCFVGGDNPYSIIENPAITDGSACILLKESYGNAFAPFLVDHFQTVIIIDYRYYRGNVNDLIKEYKVKDVILLNNVEALSPTHVDELLTIFW